MVKEGYGYGLPLLLTAAGLLSLHLYLLGAAFLVLAALVLNFFRDPDRVAEAVQNAAAVISAIHGFIGTGGVTPESVDRDGNAHLISAAARNGAAFMLISAIGAAPDHPWELMRAKHAAEETLRQSGVPYAIIRPPRSPKRGAG